MPGLRCRPAVVSAPYAAITAFVFALSGCEASDQHQDQRIRTVVSSPRTGSARPGEIMSLSALATFEGRCPRGARSWTLRFVDTAKATDTFRYRVGTGARHTVNIDPGDTISIDLRPGAARIHEPADRFVPPPGQGRGRTMAMSVPTTALLDGVIYQATEPETLRADVELALSTAGGESGQCVLVGSNVSAFAYPNSRP